MNVTVTPTSDDSNYTWRTIDHLNGIEMRQEGLDTYTLRSATHTVIVNSEGWDAYRQGGADWNSWMQRNNVGARVRDDF